MIDFLNRLFGRQNSGATAKERLRLVLMSDHLSLAPEMVEAMKRDFIDVISKYVDVDRDKIDVHFEHQDAALAMLANIPITGVNRNGSTTNGSSAETTATVAETPVTVAETNGAPAETTATVAETNGAHVEVLTACHAELVEARPSVVEAPLPSHVPRRKRRRKNAGASGGGAQISTA